MSLRRTIFVEVRDSQFQKHVQRFKNYITSSKRDTPKVGNAAQKAAKRVSDSLSKAYEKPTESLGKLAKKNRETTNQIVDDAKRQAKAYDDVDKEIEGIFRDTHGRLRESNGRYVRETSLSAEALERLGRKSNDTTRKAQGFWARLRGDVREFGVEVGGISDRLGVFGRVMSTLGKAATSAIGAIAALFVGIAAASIKATAEAIKFEKAMVSVQKTTGATDSELAILSDSILSLSKRLGTSKLELAEIAEVAGQLGIQGANNIAAFTETVAKLTRVTDLSPTEAGELVAKIANVFDIAIEESGRIGSVLNELSNTTTATAGKIAGAINRVGSAGAGLGLTVDQIAALSVVLIDSGVVAERAGTQLRNIFVFLQTKAEEVANTIGITRQEFDSLISEDALGAINLYLDSLRKLPPNLATIEIEKVFGQENTLALQTLVRQTDLLNKSLETSAMAFDENKSLNDEFARTLDSVSAKWQIFTNRINVAATSFGQRFLPLLERSIEKLIDFTESFDDANKTLLRVLKQQNADPLQIKKVQLRVDRKEIKEQIDKLKDQVENTKIDFGTRTSVFLRPLEKEFKNAEKLSTERLQELQKRLLETIDELTEKVEKQEDEEFARGLANRADFVSDLIGDIDELINAREGIDLLNKELEKTEKELTDLRSGNSSDSDPPPPEPPPIDPFSPEEISSAREAFDKILEAQKLLEASTKEERDALREVFEIQERIAELKELSKILGVSETNNVIKAEEARLQAALDSVESARKVNELFKGAGVSGAEALEKIRQSALLFLGPNSSIAEGIEGRISAFSAELAALENDFASGALSADVYAQRLDNLSDSFIDGLTELRSKLKALGLLTPELEKLFNQAFGQASKNVKTAAKETDKLKNNLRNISAIGRQVLSLASVFGGLSEEARNFAEGILEAIDNMERLIETRSSLSENGVSLDSAQGILSQASSFIGIASGLFQAVQGLGRFIQGNNEAEARRIEEERRLRNQLRDNERAIRDNTEAILSGQIGSEFSQDQIDAGLDLVSDATENTGDTGGPRGGGGRRDGRGLGEEEARSRLDNLFAGLDDLGLGDAVGGTSNLQQQFDDLLESGVSVQEAFNMIASQVGDSLRNLDAGLGTFSNSIDGAFQSLDFFARYISEDAQEQFDFFLAALLALEELPDDLRKKLNDLLDVDITTEEGKEQLRTFGRELAIALQEGNLDLGGLTPEEMEEIIARAFGFSEAAFGDSGSGLTDTTSIQIQRTITEVQANLVIQLLQEIAYFNRVTASTLNGVDFSIPDLGGTQISRGIESRAGSASINNSYDVNVTIGPWGDIDELMVEIESEIRRKVGPPQFNRNKPFTRRI